MKHFVIIPTTFGPQPQLWHERPVTGEGKDQVEPLREYELTPQEARLVDCGHIGLNYFVERMKRAA